MKLTTPKDAMDPIVRRLREIAEQSPDLQDAARAYEVVLPILRDADLSVAPLSLTSGQIHAKMERGMPLLHDIELDFDAEAAQKLMIRLARAIEDFDKKNQPALLRLPWTKTRNRPHAATMIRLALEEKRLDACELLPHVASGGGGPISEIAGQLGLDSGLVATLTKNALKPALRAWRREVAPKAEGISWNRGECFVCGAAAALGELRENGQVKHLRCGSCGADWTFGRLRCIHCGNEDHRTQRYFSFEKKDAGMRVEACDRCKGYLKVIFAFSPTPVELLPVEDLATLHLDYAAQERGYSRPGAGTAP